MHAILDALRLSYAADRFRSSEFGTKNITNQ